MLEQVAAQGIENVVVLFLDRFGRNPREILRRYWALQESGTTVFSINEDLQEELMLLLRAAIAGQESKRTSERVRLALREAALRGTLVGRISYGYARVRDAAGDHVIQVPDEVHVIRLAYNLATVENLGYKAIADRVNGLGHRTRAGRPFSSETIKLILTNPALHGRMVFNGSIGDPVVRDAAYPAILTSEEWDKLCQRLMIRREARHKGRTNVSRFLLSGVLKCGHCAGPMAGNDSNYGRYRYYICAQNKRAAALCSERNPQRLAELENAVLEHLGHYSDPDIVRGLLEAQVQQFDAKDESELERVKRRLSELEQGFLNDLERLDRAIINEAQYILRRDKRAEEQDGLHERQVALEASVIARRDVEAKAASIPAKVGTFLEDFRSMEIPKAKAVLQGILKTITVWNDGRVEVEFRG